MILPLELCIFGTVLGGGVSDGVNLEPHRLKIPSFQPPTFSLDTFEVIATNTEEKKSPPLRSTYTHTLAYLTLRSLVSASASQRQPLAPHSSLTRWRWALPHLPRLFHSIGSWSVLTGLGSLVDPALRARRRSSFVQEMKHADEADEAEKMKN